MDQENRMRDIELKQAEFLGFIRATKIYGTILTFIIFLFLGIANWYELPKLVRKVVEKEIVSITKQEIQKQVAEDQNIAEGALQEVKNQQINSLTNIKDDLLSVKKQLLIQSYILQDLNSPLAESEDPNSLIPTVPLPEEITIFADSWAKEGYYLPIEDKLRLLVKDIQTQNAIINLTDTNNKVIKEMNITLSKPVEYENYTIQLKDIRAAGFNRFTKACFFTVKKKVDENN